MLKSEQLAHLPSRLRKRDGSVVQFDSGKILSAIQRAGSATGEFGQDEAQLLTAQVIKVLSHLTRGTPEIERVQDIVE